MSLTAHIPQTEVIDVTTADQSLYRWHSNGQSVLGGSLLRLYRNLDTLFLRLADEHNAQEYAFPTFIRARELNKLGYFTSFPHLITFPVCLDSDEANLTTFAKSAPMDADGCIHLTGTAKIKDVLTPAACYHLYVHFQGQKLQAPLYLTTRNTCFRRETHYLPLQRQWSFGMREIVCLGTMDEVKSFLDDYRRRLGSVFEQLEMPIDWQVATDPFFSPQTSAKYLMQKLEPVKNEMVFDGHLAIGSINFHRNYFGEAFEIQRWGEDAFSGCVAFGLERWVHAFLNQYGLDEKGWPDLTKVRVS